LKTIIIRSFSKCKALLTVKVREFFAAKFTVKSVSNWSGLGVKGASHCLKFAMSF
jgi:hypothetical protein